MECKKILDYLKTDDIDNNTFINYWKQFYNILYSPNQNNENPNIIKRVLDNFIIKWETIYTQKRRIIVSNMEQNSENVLLLPTRMKNLITDLINKKSDIIKIINSGTYALLIKQFTHLSDYPSILYICNLINSKITIKKNFIISLINAIENINYDINKNNINTIDIYFHTLLIYVYKYCINYNIIITEKEYNYLYKIELEHIPICSFHHKSNIISLWNYGFKYYWYVKVCDNYLANTNIDYNFKKFKIENKEQHICPNCNKLVYYNSVHKEIKDIFSNTILPKKKRNSNNTINYNNSNSITFSDSNCDNNIDSNSDSDSDSMGEINNMELVSIDNNINWIYIFDGGNIGFHHNKSNKKNYNDNDNNNNIKENEKKLNITLIKLALKQSKWYNASKIIVFNIKHCQTVGDKLNDIPNLEIIYSERNKDDDLTVLKYWLTFRNSYLITNDMYNNHIDKFKNNQLLSYSWNKLTDIQQIKFNFIHKNKKLKFVYNMPHFSISWDNIYNRYHIPSQDTDYYYCYIKS